jgi:hypothetical protein
MAETETPRLLAFQHRNYTASHSTHIDALAAAASMGQP